jgi:hypothetical protein
MQGQSVNGIEYRTDHPGAEDRGRGAETNQLCAPQES